MAATPDDRGYWLVSSDGTVFHYGDAHFYGSVSTGHERGHKVPAHIVAIAATPDGRGYWLVVSDGAVLRYGDAHLYGRATRDHVDHMAAIA